MVDPAPSRPVALKSAVYVAGSVFFALLTALIQGLQQPTADIFRFAGRMSFSLLLGLVIGVVLRWMHRSTIPRTMFWTSLYVAAASLFLLQRNLQGK